MRNIIYYFNIISISFFLFPIYSKAQSVDNRIVFISSYAGSACYTDEDGDVRLMNDVFGDEGWEHLTYSTIDTSGLFSENTCLIFLDGYCDYEAFKDFHIANKNRIENFVNSGGGLYINVINYDESYYIGFDSISFIDVGFGSSWADIINTTSEIYNGPIYPLTTRLVGFLYSGPGLGYGSFSGNNYNKVLIDTTMMSIGEDSSNYRELVISKNYGNGGIVLSCTAPGHWDDNFENYRNLRRNILYSLSGCLHGDADISPIYVLSPEASCNLGEAENISFLIYNYGMLPQNNYTVSYQIDSGEIMTETFNINIEPQFNDTITFNTTANFTGCGLHQVKAWTTLLGDTINTNDTLYVEIENICAPISSSGLPDTVCINSAPFYAMPEKGDGIFSGIGITADGLFDPAIVGINNTTMISYTYHLPIDYTLQEFTFYQPELIAAEEIYLSDADYEKINIGFTFPYFDNSYDSVFISSNGYMSFGSGYTASFISIPDAVFNNLIALAGADLNPEFEGHVFISKEGIAPNRKCIIRFDDVFVDFMFGETVDVSAILYETSGVIELFIHHLPYVDILGFNQGISNDDGTIGFNTKNPNNYDWGSTEWGDETDSLAFRFTPTLCERIITDTIFVTGDYAENILGNDTTFCIGGELTLTANKPGIHYLWNTGDTIQTITITEAGIYTVQLNYDINGDCLLYDTISITTEEKDLFQNVLGNDTTICWGDTFDLFATYSTILSQQWNTTETSDTILISVTGMYSIEIEYESGCSLYDSIYITESDSLALSFDIMNSPDNGPHGSVTVFIEGGTEPYTIDWSDGFTTATISEAWPGTYTILVTDFYGCSVVDTISIGIGVEIKTENDDALYIFPNPTTQTLNIFYLNENKIQTIKTYSVIGNEMFLLFNQNLSADISSFTNGLYYTEIMIENKKTILPWVKI